MDAPTVARINVTPVKSTTLHHPDAVLLEESGVAGDRRFLFIEPDGSRISGAGKAPLLPIRADLDAEADRLSFTFPSGAGVEGSAAAAGEPFRVRLFDRQIAVREVNGELARGASARLGRRVRLARVQPGYTAGGSRPATLVSLASVADLGVRAARERIPDPARFRMLFELDGCTAYEEDGWSGREVQIGEAVLRVGAGVPRCVITNFDPGTGEPDVSVLDTLAAYRRRGKDLPFGVYGDVVEPGVVRVGDPVSLL